ncbi:MAG: hypothetical protein ACLU5J_09165 [Christensenellales bacterium]
MTCEYRLGRINSYELGSYQPLATGKMKGCVVMYQNTCITIDVSQNISHIQGFIGPNKPLCKARTMRHSNQGFQFILTLKDIIESKSNETPLIIFEFTGIYHKSLEKFLISQKS